MKIRLFMVKYYRDAFAKLGEQKLQIAFELARNVRLCDKTLGEAQELAKELFEKYADKGEDGKVKAYTEGDKQVSKISDPESLKIYNDAILTLENEEHDLPFVKFPASKLVSVADWESLLPFVDELIDETK